MLQKTTQLTVDGGARADAVATIATTANDRESNGIRKIEVFPDRVLDVSLSRSLI